MRTALLRGQDHTDLGAIGLVSEGPAAIAICKGGAMKTYSHLDPNEDAACFAIGDGGMLVAVADGHDGASGAEAAVRALLELESGTCLYTPGGKVGSKNMTHSFSEIILEDFLTDG